MVVRELVTLLGFKTDKKSLKKYEDTAKKALNVSKKLALGVGTALLGIGAASIKAAGDMEMLTTQFEVMLGSADKATNMMDRLKVFAATTPFAINDLAKGTQNLLAAGVGAGEVVETMRMLGDTAGGSAEKLQGLVLGYQKMKSTGKASLEVLNIFAERGIPVFAEMQKNLGITREQFFKMVSAGKISTQDVTNAFKTMTSEGGLFFKGMEKQSLTFQGLVSTMKDNFKLLAASIGEGLLPAMKQFVGVMTQLAQGPLKELAGGLTKVLIPIFDILLKEILPELIKTIVPLLTVVGRMLGKVLKIIAPVLKILTPIVKLVEALAPLIEVLLDIVLQLIMPLMPILIGVVNMLVPIVDLIARLLAGLLRILPIAKIIIGLIVGGLLPVIGPVLAFLKIVSKFIESDFFQNFIKSVNDLIELIKSKVFGLWDALLARFHEKFKPILNTIKKLGRFIPGFKAGDSSDAGSAAKKGAAASILNNKGATSTTLTSETNVTVQGNATAETANEIGKAVSKAAHAAFTIELKKILVEASS